MNIVRNGPFKRNKVKIQATYTTKVELALKLKRG